MKTLTTFSLALIASMSALLAPTGDAIAAPAIHNGSICQHWNPGEANYPIYYADGIKNSSSTAKYVICPLVVTHTSGKTTGSVYVDFNTSESFSCTLYSYNWNDTFLGSKSATAVAGSKYVFIGSVPANTYSNHSVLCRLPASYKGKVVAIESNF